MAYSAAMTEKLNKIIQDGRNSVQNALVDIHKEFETRKDFIVKPEAIKFNVNGGLHARIGDLDTTFTGYSRNQLLSKINMPTRFYDKLTEHEDMKDLAGLNLERLTRKFAGDGLMFRNVNGLNKGVLSPSFGRYDASPLFQAFIERALQSGWVPMKGHNTDYRYSITFILPELKEIAPSEYIVFALTFRTSDYGGGANDISLDALRVVCTNLAIGMSLLRKIHIGSRFSGAQDFIEMSNSTHQLDVRTISSAIRDIVGKSTEMLPTFEQKLIETAANSEYNIPRALSEVQKKYGREIADSAKTLYNTAGLEALPEIPGVWRFSNVLSLMAQSQTPDLRLDLEQEAGRVLNLAA